MRKLAKDLTKCLTLKGDYQLRVTRFTRSMMYSIPVIYTIAELKLNVKSEN